MPKQQYRRWCIGLMSMVSLECHAYDRRCDPPLYGDSQEAVSRYQADSDRPVGMLQWACEAKFYKEKRGPFRAAGITDVQIEERYPVAIALLYIEAQRAKLHASATPTSVIDFSLDGKELADKSAFLTLSGMYIKQGNVESLFASTQAVLQSNYYTSGAPPPSIPLLTENASREFRKHLLGCQAHATYSQIGCPVTIWGQATICTQTNAFGVTRDVPCIHVIDGE